MSRLGAAIAGLLLLAALAVVAAPAAATTTWECKGINENGDEVNVTVHQPSNPGPVSDLYDCSKAIAFSSDDGQALGTRAVFGEQVDAVDRDDGLQNASADHRELQDGAEGMDRTLARNGGIGDDDRRIYDPCGPLPDPSPYPNPFPRPEPCPLPRPI